MQNVCKTRAVSSSQEEGSGEEGSEGFVNEREGHLLDRGMEEQKDLGELQIGQIVFYRGQPADAVKEARVLAKLYGMKTDWEVETTANNTTQTKNKKYLAKIFRRAYLRRFQPHVPCHLHHRPRGWHRHQHRTWRPHLCLHSCLLVVVPFHK